MLTLGIDSSTDILGIGLADTSQIILEERVDSAREHASQIIDTIDHTLTQSSKAATDLDGIAVAIGPGSFTGLRIGLAAAKGMAFALRIPIVGISTFEIMARRLLPEYETFYLAAVVRKGEFYLCRVAAGIDIPRNVILVGEAELMGKVGSTPIGLVGRIPSDWQQLEADKIAREKLVVSGGELARHGAERLAGGNSDDLASLQPLYIAPSQAERKYGRR